MGREFLGADCRALKPRNGELLDDPLDVRKPFRAHQAKCEPQFEHVIAGQSIGHLRAFAFGLHEVRSAQHLEMLRDVRDGHLRLGSQGIDVAWSLGKQVDQFQPALAGQGLSNARELPVQPLLIDTMRHGSDFSENCSLCRLFKISIDKSRMKAQTLRRRGQ